MRRNGKERGRSKDSRQKLGEKKIREKQSQVENERKR